MEMKTPREGVKRTKGGQCWDGFVAVGSRGTAGISAKVTAGTATAAAAAGAMAETMTTEEEGD